MEFHMEFMIKKILFGLLNGILWVSFCNVEKAFGAASSFPREMEKGDFSENKRKVMKKKHSGDKARSTRPESDPQKPEKSSRSRSVEPTRKAELPPPPPLPQELPKPEGIRVVCNARVSEVYKLCDRCTTELWQTMLDLTERIAEERKWCD
jgi:hypothetical protein